MSIPHIIGNAILWAVTVILTFWLFKAGIIPVYKLMLQDDDTRDGLIKGTALTVAVIIGLILVSV